MTTLVQTRARAVASLADSVVSFVRDLADASAKRAAYRDTVLQLRALGDRELDDLGVSRWDIETVARRSVYGA
ncbi:MAG: hypothetical protein COW75_09610 [Rhodobacterales bacterium CG18_big_fil_WC_8_21_14_2_50_71_9]|nr:MAG: hypothetical protein COW75_09610 [Rhodobacterales bacterium CG18_big_fil_WC_8_21_14_2_50_71_9]PIY73504.1 MAG: hypothetical protein COY86_06085 [Rhodobacterales bacterium CG_4_10_14_0_8_um_filter_70_9]